MKLESVRLLYNAAAHFEVSARYPDGLISAMKVAGVESYDAMLYAFTEMAKQAELYKRFLGEKPRRVLTEDEWRMIIKPGQLQKATEMVFGAMTAGLNSTDDEDQEIDEVLLELEKKTNAKN